MTGIIISQSVSLIYALKFAVIVKWLIGIGGVQGIPIFRRTIQMQIVEVACKIKLTVAVPDDWTEEMILFNIEKDGCPGTGLVGAQLERLIADSNTTRMCWACPEGYSKVLTIDGQPVKENAHDRSY